MAVIAPPSVSDGKTKKVKTDSSFLKTALISGVRDIISTDNGMMTKAQGIAERLLNIALYAESNTDAIAASKVIFERIYGKAAIEKVEESKEMPKIIFALNDTGLEKINKAVAEADREVDEDEQEIGVLAKTDDGKEFLI